MQKEDEEIEAAEKRLEPEAEPMLNSTPMRLLPKEADDGKPPPYEDCQLVEAPAIGRETWNQKIDFLLAVVGFAVDLGNVWRFPYICYRNGGGAFLVPYLVMYIFGGLPLFYMELALGQYQRCGCITVWKRICPMFKGVGIGICIAGTYVAFYYNTIMAWALYFLYQSIACTFNGGVLPWMTCQPDEPRCRTFEQKLNNSDIGKNCTTGENGTCTLSSSEVFFYKKVLEIQNSNGIGDVGGVKPEIAICLVIVFAIVYFSIWKGVKSSGKAVWFTATMPYIVLLILLIRGLMLEGSMGGIWYYLTPKWERLLDVQVWNDAASQIFFSLGPGFGVLLALSSYNKFNNNCYADAMITSSINCCTSFLAGFVVFSVLGNMAYRLGKDMDTVASEGPGLVFMAYPEAIGTLRGSVFWAILFFIMLITLGLDSTYGGLEAIITGILDEFPKLQRRRELFVLGLIVYCFIGGLATTTYGGFYVLNLLDQHGAPISLLFIVCVEGVALCWFYGHKRFSADVKKMLGFAPGPYWQICWTFISPVFLMAIFIANLIFYESRPVMVLGEAIPFPKWAIGIGWMITMSSLVMVPVYFFYKLAITPGTLKERFMKISQPEELPPHVEVLPLELLGSGAGKADGVEDNQQQEPTAV
ncbi:hypothetical protein BOX15_Mlig016702g1 [Macrostomum lignano]|uniref:Transporter n=1 Tax=Macrostomum lignano TaxID=282301 RepID=A0A267E503_9PLAT|nr:hypothetical protein BOX15_Mlig016702g2 [Macrostomum lignano]PAA71279.1 hypothetical protein BOX15_Mlig016702g1 [Macrostomum lignano]